MALKLLYETQANPGLPSSLESIPFNLGPQFLFPPKSLTWIASLAWYLVMGSKRFYPLVILLPGKRMEKRETREFWEWRERIRVRQPEFEGYRPKTSKNVSEDTSNEVRESPDAQWPNSAVVNVVRANQVNAVKASACWVWRPTKLNSASITFKRHNYGHLQKEDQGYVDSGCSRHMTWNMSYLSEFKEFDGGYVTFGGGAKGEKITGTNSNDLTGTEESIGAGHSSKETGSSQDYILMSLWKDGSLFDSSSKNASNDEPQPSSDARKKDDEGVSQESGIDD
ncbi:hypothetical protein Tco_0215739 [Tanacetum coccineum]